VFEKIDSAGSQSVSFRVPEEAFKGAFELEAGDGMYRVGMFLAASGERILDVFRRLKQLGLTCSVKYYFFTSWYLDVEQPPEVMKIEGY
jgi:hypothetical protein